MTQSDVNNPLRIGYAWSGDFQLTTVYDGIDQLRGKIVSSDTSNPCKVVTAYPHGLSAGKICIDGHTPNLIVNGNHSILIVDSVTISLTGVTGQVAGGQTGIIEQVIDASTFTSFTVTAKNSTVNSGLAHPVITLTWIDQTIFSFTLSITAAESLLTSWSQQGLIVTVAWIDGSNNDAEDINIPIINV